MLIERGAGREDAGHRAAMWPEQDRRRDLLDQVDGECADEARLRPHAPGGACRRGTFLVRRRRYHLGPEQPAGPAGHQDVGQTGTPQGGVISPLMCNVYLHRLDRAWDEHDGTVIRDADDLVVRCSSRGQTERALARLADLLGELGLTSKAAKTRILHLEVGGEGFDFLGFHHHVAPRAGKPWREGPNAPGERRR
ncbi:reverse transcriptase domain-containing protein [Streptomyces collinus]|uniref:reverse transcriptase domain-containing protein n=1 Tax=Streptomyces collinus TaxID=42684 RepID=UPI003330DB16